MKQMFFCYDPEGEGFTLHDTFEESRDHAESVLAYARDCAFDNDGKWDETITKDLCYGKLVGYATEERLLTGPVSRRSHNLVEVNQ